MEKAVKQWVDQTAVAEYQTKGYVTVRWYGASNGCNGYYSETASFVRLA